MCLDSSTQPVDLRSALMASVPQAGGEPLVANDLTLRLSEILVQAVCPLAHRTNMEPQHICLKEREKVEQKYIVETLVLWTFLCIKEVLFYQDRLSENNSYCVKYLLYCAVLLEK